jgi:hypothetical protein
MPEPTQESEGLREQVEALAARASRLDTTVWQRETVAQEYEDRFVALWDALRSSDDKYAVLKRFPFDALVFRRRGTAASHDGDVIVTALVEAPLSLTPQSWSAFLDSQRERGFEIVQSEWHHERFEIRPDGTPHSTVTMLLHVRHDPTRARYVIKGNLEVDWHPKSDDSLLPSARHIEVVSLRVLERRGEPVFRSVLEIESRDTGADPALPMLLMTYDLDGDGLVEILLPSSNTVYRNRGGRFEKDALTAHPLGYVRAAVVADFTGDGFADILGADKGLPLLYAGDEHGLFQMPPTVVDLPEPLVLPSVITCGDIDADGDLDVWIGQYRLPYVEGRMPTPYYDANDGYPASLLLNDGTGRFADVTEQAGLGAKRYRRTYASSFVDLDEDHDLDLLVTSDFAGADVYVNDGTGRFADVTKSILDEAHNFGMSHTFSDYNGDGRLDFFVIGMSSTTARRLTHMQLGRDDFEDHQRFRPIMGYGNRMYLATDTGFEQAAFNDSVARSGWSWGSTSFDFDNDGDRDVYVANGHISANSAKDYCTMFWRHDIYMGDSSANAALEQFFESTHTLLSEISWNGFEHNCLFMNEERRGFLEVGYLMDVAFEFDARGVVGDDLDADGKVDLLVTEARRPDGPVVHMLQNTWHENHNWIGVRLRDEGPGLTAVGARVVIEAASGRQVAQIVRGDSNASQHSNTVHFGLGSDSDVEWLKIRWPNGTVRHIPQPEINRYHDVRAREPRGSTDALIRR